MLAKALITDEDKLAEWYFELTMDFWDLNEAQQRALWRFYTREKALIELECDYNVTRADGTYYVDSYPFKRFYAAFNISL